MKNKVVVVTGGVGFIGSNLVEELTKVFFNCLLQGVGGFQNSQEEIIRRR